MFVRPLDFEMESEIIYEANGEFSPIISFSENNNISSNTVDKECFQPPDDNIENMQSLFSQGMTDDAVVDFIFNSCDKEKTGFVQATELIDFFLKVSGNNEICNKFSKLMDMLDPSNINPLVDVKMFQCILKAWIAKIVPNIEDSKSQLYDSFSSKIDVEQEDAERSLCSDMKELKHHCDKLQEDNQLLLTQITDVEESSCWLRSENSKLKLKMNKLESEVGDYGKQTQLLQEDNCQLQDNLLQAKDDLQELRKHYNQCKTELEEKVAELEMVQMNLFKEKDRSKDLLQTILELQDLVLSKEEALLNKDKEIQSIAKDLVDQQLMSDRSLTSYARRSHVTGDTLASELQSSFTPERLADSDFFHRAEWNVMINEPEFEEHGENSNASGGVHSSQSSRRSTFEADIDHLNSDLVSQSFKNEGKQLDPILHRSDQSEPISTNGTELTKKGEAASGFLTRSKWLFWMLTYMICIFLTVMLMAAWCWMLLSLFFSPDCGMKNGFASYLPSCWTEVIELLKPYCRLEHHGYHPV